MIALARKYRPRRFSDLLVQDHVAAALRGAVARGRVGHGYLLTGPRGTGKTTAARILAMALNCQRRQEGGAAGLPDGEPCGECLSCERIWSGAATLDVVEIDAASNRGVDDARDLRERAMYAASQEGRHKVYIVDEAHMLTREAWNALLKILEEPPPGVVFVFATTEPQKIASTAAPVLSRLQRFDFRRIGPAAIRDRLREVLGQEGLRAEEDALAVIARYADGGMRDALSVLDQVLAFGGAEEPVTAAGVRQVLGLIDDEQYAEILRAIADRDTAAVFPLVERLVDAGADLAEFMSGTADLLRAVLMVETGAEPEGLTETQRQAIAAVRGKLGAADLVRMLTLLADAEAGIRRSASARLIVETLLLRWTVMDRVVDLDKVLESGAGPRHSAPGTRESPGGSRPATSGLRESAGGGSVAPGLREPAGGGAAASGPRESAGGGPAAPGPREPAGGPRQTSPGIRTGAGDPGRKASGAAGGPPVVLDQVAAAWPEIVAQARERSHMLGEALEAALPGVLAGSTLELEARPGQEFLVQGALERYGAVVEEILAARFSAPLSVRWAPRGSPVVPGDLREAELERLRRRDPALDAAVTELDLEIVDDRLPRPPRS